MSSYPRPSGLTASEELLRGMIRDNTHVTRQTRDLVVEMRAERGHISAQIVGLTERMWRVEDEVKTLKAGTSGSLWSGLMELANKKERAAFLAVVVFALLGITHPKDIRVKLHQVLGLPPPASASASGSPPGVSPAPASFRPSLRELMDVP